MKERMGKALLVVLLALFGAGLLAAQKNTAPAQAYADEYAPTQGLQYVLSGDSSYYTAKIGSATTSDIVVPSTYNGLPVRDVNFANTDVTTVILPDSITTIAAKSFQNCTELWGILLPDSVTAIGDYAFAGCSSLYNGTIPENLVSIGDYAFAGCSVLEGAPIPDSVTSIGEYAFLDCNALWEVQLPEGLRAISEGTFKNCKGLMTAYLPESLTEIGDYAFYGCETLDSGSIPANLQTIGDYAFVGCKGFYSIALPDTVKTIGAHAFEGCSTLYNLELGKGLEAIGEKAFFGCNGLERVENNSSLELEMGSTAYGYVAYYAKTLVDTNASVADIMGVYEGAYVATQGITGLTLSIYKTEELLKDSSLLKRYADIATNCCKDENGAPKQVFTEKDIRKIIEAHPERYIALFNFFPLIDEGGVLPNPDVEEGLYTMTVSYDTHTGKYSFLGSQWIQRNTYQFGHLLEIEIDGDKLFGDVCGQDNYGDYHDVGDVQVTKNGTQSGYRIDFLDRAVSVGVEEEQDVHVIVKNDQGLVTNQEVAIRWISADESIVTVEGTNWGIGGVHEAKAILCGVSEGETYIYAELDNKRVAKCKVVVSATEEKSYSIAVITTEKSLRVRTGESIRLGFGLIDNDTGEVDDNWREMGLVVSDPNILSVGNYKKDGNAYLVDVEGVKEGKTYLTITDTESGASTILLISVEDKYNRSYTYAIDKLQPFYPNNEHEKHIPTYFYDLNGIYVNNYKAIKQGNGYQVSFDAYNAKYAIAAVDIYDANGEWQGSAQIDRLRSITGFWDTGKQAFFLITDHLNHRMLTYEQAVFAAHTSVSFTVPDGGYFTISNNMMESPGTFLYNAAEIFFDAAMTSANVAANPKTFKAFADELVGELVIHFDLKNIFIAQFQDACINEFKDFNVNIGKASIEEGCIGITELFKSILKATNFKWEHLFSSTTGLAESIFEEFFKTAGTRLKLCFAINKTGDHLLRLVQLTQAFDEPYIEIRTQFDGEANAGNGIIVNTVGNMAEGAVLQTFKVSSDDSLAQYLGDTGNRYYLYNISFVKNDETVQPNGKVQVKIPIPKGMDASSCTVYRKEESGFWTPLHAYVDGKYLVFETDHFSLYGIAGKPETLKINALPIKRTYQVGEILDTAGLQLSLGGEQITEGYVCDTLVLYTAGEQVVTVRYGDASVQFTVAVGEKPEQAETSEPSSDSALPSGGCSCNGGISSTFGVFGGCLFVILVKKRKE